jgi:hypothetical protein
LFFQIFDQAKYDGDSGLSSYESNHLVGDITEYQIDSCNQDSPADVHSSAKMEVEVRTLPQTLDGEHKNYENLLMFIDELDNSVVDPFLVKKQEIYDGRGRIQKKIRHGNNIKKFASRPNKEPKKAIRKTTQIGVKRPRSSLHEDLKTYKSDDCKIPNRESQQESLNKPDTLSRWIRVICQIEDDQDNALLVPIKGTKTMLSLGIEALARYRELPNIKYSGASIKSIIREIKLIDPNLCNPNVSLEDLVGLLLKNHDRIAIFLEDQ